MEIVVQFGKKFWLCKPLATDQEKPSEIPETVLFKTWTFSGFILWEVLDS